MHPEELGDLMKKMFGIDLSAMQNQHYCRAGDKERGQPHPRYSALQIALAEYR